MADVQVLGDPLYAGVGTWVADDVPLSFTVDSNVPETATYQEVNAPWLCQAEIVTGTLTGTTGVWLITVVQADDSSGTNAEVVAAFPAFNEDDDDETHSIPVEITRQYVTLTSTEDSASMGGTAVVTLRDLDYHRFSRTAA